MMLSNVFDFENFVKRLSLHNTFEELVAKGDNYENWANLVCLIRVDRLKLRTILEVNLRSF